MLALLLPLGACSLFSPRPILHGARVDPDQLKELVPGTSTKADATSLLGSPTAHATFDDNTWIYISESTHTRIGRLPGVGAQDVEVLSFDQGGTLRNMRHLGQAESQPVTVASRTTPSPGTEATFLQQLLGNVGKFNPGGSVGGTGGGTSAGAANLGQQQ
jgi:outer membrane protein assembly factor BamE (lipoprotein component of BamABCDE complex)